MRRRDEVVELRNYLVQPGQRDVLIELFERHFIESQEELGSNVLGSFRNIDDPDRFVWLRGFGGFDTRFAALDGFYNGDVWKAHRSAANATMIDSDDVLLLRPVSGDLSRDPRTRAPIGAAMTDSLIVVTMYFLAPYGDEGFGAFFTKTIASALTETGGAPLATFATEHSANTFPRLPVRENETVFISIARFASVARHDAHRAALAVWPEWRRLESALRGALIAPTQTLRLQPTARSLLR
jgi:hypothetical protein